MLTTELVTAEKAHLAQLLEAIQRCVYFLHVVTQKIPFPLHEQVLELHKKEENLFTALAAFNERFAKLQDTLSTAMRHAYLLSAEQGDSFLKILAFYEKQGIVESIEIWQLLRTARNIAAHDYETDYSRIAEHFNTLYKLSGMLYQTAKKFIDFCEIQLAIKPKTLDFQSEFLDIIKKFAQYAYTI